MTMIPKIRFSEFVEEWKETTLADVAFINPHSEIPNVFEYVDLESVSGTQMLNHRTEKIESAPSRAQRLAKKGDIFYQTVRPYQKNNYYFDIDSSSKYVFSSGYAQIRTSIDGKFLFSLLQSDFFVNQVLENCTGTSYPAIAPSALAKLKIKISPTLSEQCRISQFFTLLDETIRLEGERLLSLKQVKAASLQSFFPQEGEKEPRVRFKGFSGEWKKVKIGEIFKERNEQNIHGEMLSVTMNNGIIKASENGRFDNSNDDKSHYKVVKIGDIAYNSMRMWQGASGCSAYEGIVSPAYTVLNPQEGIDSLFFSYLFKCQNMLKVFRFNSQGLTSDTWNLKYPTLSQIEIQYPESLAEQRALSTYFTNIDEQIRLVSEKIEKMKKVKGACLEGMMV